MDSRAIRDLFTSFWEEHGHRAIPSSSLIPPPDERSLLFTTAGMLQMKPYFMGLAPPPAARLTTVQKCFRANDIELVGDRSHCTFFEMLGNFSVGDYFKAEVIPWAWELLTTAPPKGLGLSKERIWPTIFLEDEEAFELWRKFVPAERIVRYGEDKNYWFMGPVGPCGPNSEIFYDFGADQGCLRSDCHPNCDQPLPNAGGTCDRYIEIWNLVFMTLFQAEDGSRRPLPQRNVDTGGGFERWPMAYMFEHGVDWQGNAKTWDRPPTIYDSDLFQPLLASIEKASGLIYSDFADPSIIDYAQFRAMRILAEHTRAATFLIGDGVMPSNEDRGYVLRRLIRRAVYFGRSISVSLESITRSVIELMKSEYPSLGEQAPLILRTLSKEEEQFRETIQRGSVELDGTLATLVSQADGRVVSGERIFYLHDTYGFPMELTREIAEGRGFDVNKAGFEALMAEQRERSRAAPRFEGGGERLQTYAELALPPTAFLGYETTHAPTTVVAIVIDGTEVVRSVDPSAPLSHPSEGSREPQASPERLQSIEIVLSETPFYAEGGGQVGDRGEIVWPGGRFVVEDTRAVGEGVVVAHVGHIAAGGLSVGDAVEAIVDGERRRDTMRNHTATHLLHAALRQVLGEHVRQAGSLVTPDRLRFDFSHMEALTPAELGRVEALANQAVREDIPVHVAVQSYEEALESGALAFFGDKYADTVRVVEVCDPAAERCFSKELCGGTHVHASGEVGAIIVAGESSIGAGLRRIEALTGRAAAERIREREDDWARLAAGLQVTPEEAEVRVAALREERDDLRKRLQATERRLAQSLVDSARGAAATGVEERYGDTYVVVERIAEAPSVDFLRDLGDGYRTRHESVVILLGAVIDEKPAFLAMATPDVAKRCSAGDIVRAASQVAGGGGGGRPELAQGGGTDVTKLDAALAAGRRLIEAKLGESA